MPNLKAIMAKKKRLQKAHPSWGNARALKEAWKGHKAKPTRTRKKRAKAKPRARKVSGSPRRMPSKRRSVSRSVTGTSLGAIKLTAREQKRMLETVLGELLVRKMLAKKVTEKRQLQKKISDIKKRINAVTRILKE